MDRLACADLRCALDEKQRDEVLEMLRAFSPNVAVNGNEPLFWLDGNGIEPLFSTVEHWGKQVFARLKRAGFAPALAVGFTCFGTAVIARCREGMTLLPSCEAETEMVMQTPLCYAGLSPRTVRDLSRLGKRTLSDLLTLPPDGLLERFGAPVRKLFELAAGRLWDPLSPVPPEVPIGARCDFDHPETSAIRLSFLAKRLLRSVLVQLRHRRLLLAGLELVLDIDHEPSLHARLEPAEPTLDEVQIADLIRLRLEALNLAAGVVGISLGAEGAPATAKQLALFKKKSRRDSRAAERALARIRAEFGPGAVVQAVLKEGHLPEARFVLVPTNHARKPRCDTSAPEIGGLVRRIYRRPIPLQARPVVGPRGAHLLGMSDAPATRINGPFVISGGWWTGGIHREYYFTETERGEILWVYFDKRRRRWFIHGVVD
jgi:protein ImuB